MNMQTIIKRLIRIFLLLAVVFQWSCSSEKSPGGNPGKDVELISRWKAYLYEPGWESVNMVKLDIIITEQERIQRFVSDIIQNLSDLVDINESLKAGKMTKPEIFASLLSSALNSLKKNVQNARTAYENYAFQMASTGVGQMIRDHYQRMMEGFPAKDHPTSKSILEYFSQAKGLPQKLVLELIAREDYHKTFTNDIFESIEERRDLFQGLERLLLDFSATLEGSIIPNFSAKEIPELSQLTNFDAQEGNTFLFSALKSIMAGGEDFITLAKNKVACYAPEGNVACLEEETHVFACIIAPAIILSARGLFAPTLVAPADLNLTRRQTRTDLNGVDAGWRLERTQTLFTPRIPMYNDPGYNDNTHVGGGDLDVTDLDDAIGMPNEYPLIYNNRTVKGLLIYTPADQKWYLELDRERIFIPNDSDISSFVKDAVYANGNRKWVKTVINFVVQKERINYATGDGYTLFLKAIEFMGEPGINITLNSVEQPGNKLLVEADAAITYSVLDDPTITGLVFYVNGKILCEKTVAPYQCLINKNSYQEGRHEISVTAFDNAGTRVQAQSFFLVNNQLPFVRSFFPKGYSISYNTGIYLTFSEAMDALTLSADHIKVTENGNPVPGSFIYNEQSFQLTFIPSPAFVPGSTYQVSITQGVTDQCGALLEYALSWTFKTNGYSANYDEGFYNGSTYVQ